MIHGTPELPHLGDLAEDAGGETVNPLPIRPAEVHKSKQQNVWIHSPIEESAHSLSTRFKIPVDRRLLRFVDLIEVQRQIGILQAHRQFGVPDGEVFTLDQIALKLVTDSSEAEVPRDYGRIRAQIVATSARGRARSLTQYFALEGPFGLVAVGSARASLIPRGVYERVRGQSRLSDPVSAVSRQSGFSYEEPLRVDVTDPLLSDHPSDHLTAMQTVADVERVVLQERPHVGLRSLKLLFQRYADAEPSPTLRLNISPSGTVAAEVMQLGVRRAHVTGTLLSKEGL